MLGPQGVVRRGAAEDRFDDLHGPGFQLIGWRHDPAALLRADQRAFFARAGGVIAGVTDDDRDGLLVDTGTAYRKFFGEHGVVAILVRPDFTVFGTARSRDATPAIIDDLRQQLAG
jgi:hypothetical protein